MAARHGAIPFFFGLASLFAGPAIATEQAPLSAIDWLSDSIASPDTATDPAADSPSSMVPSTITVVPLDGPMADRAGLIDASRLGISPDLWGRSSAANLARAITSLPDARSAPPSLLRFLHDLLVVRLDPPIDAAEDDSLFLARLDRLLELGHLSAAQRLIQTAGAPEPQRFRRAFDIALLTGTETEACKVIEETPEISTTYPARIFCLARGGQWDVAALTLGNAEALGILSTDEDKLLLHFLDPELFESEPVPPPPRVPTPLVFRLYEAVGERLPTEQLPVAFATADLTDTVGWRTRLRAVERLAAVDAIPFERLLSVYIERDPAASGGIWERVEALQAILSAVESDDPKSFAAALPGAWLAASEGGYEAAFARWISPKLSDKTLDGQSAHVAFEIALLTGRTDMAAKFSAPTMEDRFLLAIANGQSAMAPDSNLLGRAVVRGLTALDPGSQYEALIADGRQGEALLSALAVLMDGASGNPDRAANALALLRTLGLDALARQVAVELLLKEGEA